jgi:uncharacterized protein (DUF2141 family)
MRKVGRVRLARAFVAVTAAGAAAAAQEGTPTADTPTGIHLVVHASGFKHARGRAVARVFVAGEELSGPGHATAEADISGSEATITFPSLRPGEYAVIVFHDENGNGVVDHGTFGPSEPLGFSNGFRLRLLLLRFPTFEKLKFVLSPDHNRIEVRVR